MPVAESLKTKVCRYQLNARGESGGADKIQVIHVSAPLALPCYPVKRLYQPSRIASLDEFVYSTMILEVANNVTFFGTLRRPDDVRDVFGFDRFEYWQEFGDQFYLLSTERCAVPRLQFA
jgi:hypothetical protein